MTLTESIALSPNVRKALNACAQAIADYDRSAFPDVSALLTAQPDVRMRMVKYLRTKVEELSGGLYTVYFASPYLFESYSTCERDFHLCVCPTGDILINAAFQSDEVMPSRPHPEDEKESIFMAVALDMILLRIAPTTSGFMLGATPAEIPLIIERFQRLHAFETDAANQARAEYLKEMLLHALEAALVGEVLMSRKGALIAKLSEQLGDLTDYRERLCAQALRGGGYIPVTLTMDDIAWYCLQLEIRIENLLK